MALVGQTKGAISNAEMNLFLQASPTLASTYEGAILQASLLRRLSNLSIKRARDWGKAVQDGILSGAETPSARLRAARNWELSWQQKPENTFLTPDQNARLRKAAANETPESKAIRSALRPEEMSDEPTDLTDIGL